MRNRRSLSRVFHALAGACLLTSCMPAAPWWRSYPVTPPAGSTPQSHCSASVAAVQRWFADYRAPRSSTERPRHHFRSKAGIEASATQHLVRITHGLALLEGNATLSLLRVVDGVPKVDFAAGLFSRNDSQGYEASHGPARTVKLPPPTDASENQLYAATPEAIADYTRGLESYFGRLPEAAIGPLVLAPQSDTVTLRIPGAEYSTLQLRLAQFAPGDAQRVSEAYVLQGDFERDSKLLFHSLCQSGVTNSCLNPHAFEEQALCWRLLPSGIAASIHFALDGWPTDDELQQWYASADFIQALPPLQEASLAATSADRVESLTGAGALSHHEVRYAKSRRYLLNHAYVEVERYVGPLRDGRPHGVGRLYFGGEGSYIGQFADGHIGGFGVDLIRKKRWGTDVDVDVRIFAGRFEKGLREGRGSSFDIWGNPTTEALYSRGRLVDGSFRRYRRLPNPSARPGGQPPFVIDEIFEGRLEAGREVGSWRFVDQILQERSTVTFIHDRKATVLDRDGQWALESAVIRDKRSLAGPCTVYAPGLRMEGVCVDGAPVGPCRIHVPAGHLEASCVEGKPARGTARFWIERSQQWTDATVREDGSWSWTETQWVQTKSKGYLRRLWDDSWRPVAHRPFPTLIWAPLEIIDRVLDPITDPLQRALGAVNDEVERHERLKKFLTTFCSGNACQVGTTIEFGPTSAAEDSIVVLRRKQGAAMLLSTTHRAALPVPDEITDGMVMGLLALGATYRHGYTHLELPSEADYYKRVVVEGERPVILTPGLEWNPPSDRGRGTTAVYGTYNAQLVLSSIGWQYRNYGETSGQFGNLVITDVSTPGTEVPDPHKGHRYGDEFDLSGDYINGTPRAGSKYDETVAVRVLADLMSDPLVAEVLYFDIDLERRARQLIIASGGKVYAKFLPDAKHRNHMHVEVTSEVPADLDLRNIFMSCGVSGRSVLSVGCLDRQ